MFDHQPLGSLVERHVGGGTPPRSDSTFWGGSIPWASVKDFRDGELELGATEESITEAGLRASTSNLIPPGTPLVCTRMAVGRVASATVPVSINQDLRALIPTRETDNRYLLRLLASLQHRAEAQAVGSTVKGIRTADFLSMVVPVAPPREQPMIAHILDTLDTQIRRTEALIAKLEQIKQGLLTDLLTRGIDEYGELRPPPEEAPELYKESPLGRIPKDWEVSRGRRACYEIVVGIVIRPTQYYRDTGVPVLRSANVRENRLQLDDLAHMSLEHHKVLSKSAVRPGDVLTVRTGYPGTSCVVDESLAEANCVDIIISRPGPQLQPRFWALWINSDFGKGHVLRTQGGLAQQHFNVRELADMEFPLPSVEEQGRIVRAWSSLERRISQERTEVDKLNVEKAGLMDDLLTGRVRTTPLLDESAQATG